jgi:hypothetical protein
MSPAHLLIAAASGFSTAEEDAAAKRMPPPQQSQHQQGAGPSSGASHGPSRGDEATSAADHAWQPQPTPDISGASLRDAPMGDPVSEAARPLSLHASGDVRLKDEHLKQTELRTAAPTPEKLCPSFSEQAQLQPRLSGYDAPWKFPGTGTASASPYISGFCEGSDEAKERPGPSFEARRSSAAALADRPEPGPTDGQALWKQLQGPSESEDESGAEGGLRLEDLLGSAGALLASTQLVLAA